jgi:hypothetical protein
MSDTDTFRRERRTKRHALTEPSDGYTSTRAKRHKHELYDKPEEKKADQKPDPPMPKQKNVQAKKTDPPMPSQSKPPNVMPPTQRRSGPPPLKRFSPRTKAEREWVLEMKRQAEECRRERWEAYQTPEGAVEYERLQDYYMSL